MPSIEPVTVIQSPYSAGKWKIGIMPNMIVECIINFTVSFTKEVTVNHAEVVIWRNEENFGRINKFCVNSVF